MSIVTNKSNGGNMANKWWDKSWNPLYGCTQCSPGCDNCIALKNLVKQNRSTQPSFNENVLNNNLGKGLNYVVGSLGDVFHINHSTQEIDFVFNKMANFNKNRYFVLTKRSAEMLDYFSDTGLPESIAQNDWNHLWMGVTVENKQTLYRIDDLIKTPIIKNRFLCLEPLLEEISIEKYLSTGMIDWVIVGCESGEKRRKISIEAIRKIVAECKMFKVPIFVDQLNIDDKVVYDEYFFPEEVKYKETPWQLKDDNLKEYKKIHILDGAGVVGIKRTNGTDYIIKAPEYVYKYWLENFNGVQKCEIEYPFNFSPITGNKTVKKLLKTVRDFLTKTHNKLLEVGATQEQASLSIPKDVFVKFKWTPNDLEFDKIKESENKIIQQYIKAVKAITKE